MRQLDQWSWIGVKGNHETMLAQAVSSPGERTRLEGRFGHGLSICIKTLSGQDIEMLSSLPDVRRFEFDETTVTVCHGSPWNAVEYVYPDTDSSVLARMADSESDLICFGHTHYPLLTCINGTTLINPGSVGQPRDGKGARAGPHSTVNLAKRRCGANRTTLGTCSINAGGMTRKWRAWKNYSDAAEQNLGQ